MKAACWMNRRQVSFEDVPDPRILNARDAIVKVTATTICGSDLHLYSGFVPTMQRGDILGHEFMGEVVEVGPEIDDLRPGDRVVVPFAIACGDCESCKAELYACCENSNPNARLPEKLMGHATCGAFGYSHLSGGFAGGQAEYVRVPYADVGPLVVPRHLSDEQVLFLSDILPTGYMGAEFCEPNPRKVIAVWGAGPVGQMAIASLRMLGAERIIAIDRFPYRLKLAQERAGATDIINYEDTPVLEALEELTAGRGPDACIDAVGLEAHGNGLQYAYDKVKQSAKLQMDRPLALREAILACRNGGIVSILGVYAGYVDKFPLGPLMNRGLTIRSGQCHVHRYMRRLLDAIEAGDIDPSFVVSHHMKLSEVAQGYDWFLHKQHDVMKIVMHTAA
ncbi:MAG: glutathione-dependent formaldehyde dehydrogenase [Deltaproteobacteria bacterium]|nr:glutathione-dependent formaldehyde dehydrogenase [Deltaproteobacteria bacterium]MCW5803248.1 glutathione-dependent formaldehyde dehydrogenase [Deltaproteobacteria bacterium]